MALGLPLMVLVLVELILRLAGFGYSTDFFQSRTLNGTRVFVENPDFGRAYFPPGLERSPEPLRFNARKPPGTTRIFVFGESAALGDPEPAYGFSRYLEMMLNESGQRSEVLNVAMTAINSHVVLDIARECADKQGDYWIVYVGNNEVVGPFGAGTIFGPQAPSRFLVRIHRLWKSTRIGQALDRVRWHLAGPSQAVSWSGLAMFQRHAVAADDVRLHRVRSSFSENLRAIVELGRRSGARVLLSTVAVNLRDCGPFASIEKPGLSDAQKADLKPMYALAASPAFDSSPDAHGFEKAAQVAKAVAVDDRHAGLQYALGCFQLRLGQTNRARIALQNALELDALRFRADGAINRIITETARAFPDARLVDVAAWLGGHSPFSLPGGEFFFEHVHLNFAGSYQMAKCFAQVILGANTSWPTEDRCAAMLALTEFDRYRVLDEVRQRLEQAPFTNQPGHEGRMAGLRAQLAALRSGSFRTAQSIYERAIAARPDDWVLRENYGTMLRDFRLHEEARPHWRRLVELLPHSADACLGMGETLQGMDRAAEAVEWFQRAWRLRASPEVRHALGTALLRAERPAEAVPHLKRVVQLRPAMADAHYDLAIALLSLERWPEAIIPLQQTLRLQPSHPEARAMLDRIRKQVKAPDREIGKERQPLSETSR
jgi:tetratricopeptide (TPR) repeat protein